MSIAHETTVSLGHMTVHEALIKIVAVVGSRVVMGVVAPELQVENAQLREYLESLTPGGSEFHNYPVRCREWVEDRLVGVINQVKRRKATEAEVKRLRGVLTDIRVLAEADLKWDRAGFYTPQIEADACAALKPIPQENP